MNWDWDKLQERRQRQQHWRPEPDDDRDDNNGQDDNPGGPQGPGGRNFSNPFRRIHLPASGNFAALKIIVVIALILWLATGIYIVDPDEEGVVLRFGKYTETVEPGPHFHLPYPIETVYTPKVTQVQRIEVGFRTAAGQSAAFIQGQNHLVLPEEASMLTGDENIVNIQFSVQYQIQEPVEYLFNVTNQAAVVKNAAEAVMREIIGNSLIDLALADGKLKIQNDAAALLQDVLDRYKVGVRVLGVQLQDVHPPKEVSDAFKDVASAREDKSRFINEAEAYRNALLPRARGQVAEILNQANAYKETRILNAQGETQRFLAVLAEYNKAKDVTRKRMYLETMEEILGRNGMDKVLISETLAKRALPLLPLDVLATGKASAPEKSQQAASADSATGQTDSPTPAGSESRGS